MLPSASEPISNHYVLIALIAPDNANFSNIFSDLALVRLESNPPILQPVDPALSHLRFVVMPETVVDLRIVESSDALLVVLDGATGVGSATIYAWNQARDLNIPRHFAVTGVVNGRADFDELAAVATRTMEPDLIVRYLPIDSDSEESLAGIFDVLTSEIHELSNGEVLIRPGDPEHITLTADRRDDLFDQLAHLGLDDQALENHRAGLPISVTKLEAAWSNPDAISITPIEDGVGRLIIAAWLQTLSPHWIPTVTTSDQTHDVFDSQFRVGTAITESFARMWSTKTNMPLIAWNKTAEFKISPRYQDDAILLADELIPGMTISQVAFECELATPIFE